MNQHFVIPFVCMEGDTIAYKSIEALKREGYTIIVLKPGEHAPIGSIALYSGHCEIWSHQKHMRLAAHRLYPGRPEWATTTPFLVSCRENNKGGPQEAANNLVRLYERWFDLKSGTGLPWESPNNRHTTYVKELELWIKSVFDALGKEKAEELFEHQLKLDSVRGRGGWVIYNELVKTGRVVFSAKDLSRRLGSNKVYKKLTGFSGPVVSYGSSDMGNLFELLELLKLGDLLGLPVVYDTYPGAHCIGYWWEGFFNPSLAILGQTTNLTNLGFNYNDKCSQVITAHTIQKVFPSIGLNNITSEVLPWANKPLWVFYREVMRLCIDKVLRALGLTVSFAFTTTEEICQLTPYWQMNVQNLAQKLERHAGHKVNVYNKSESVQVPSSRWTYETVAELHEAGYWLGGSALYLMNFGLGEYGPLVMMVKDSSRGEVNLMSRPFLQSPHQLWLSPVGLFRLTAEGQNEDWSIDPLVFLELLHRWDREKVKAEVSKIWEHMEVPLASSHIGRKTVATVTSDGISIKVVDP